MASRKFGFKYDPTAAKRSKAPIVLTVPESLDDDEDEQSEAVPYQEEQYQADNEDDDDDDDDNIICNCASRVKKQQQKLEEEAARETVMAHGMESDTTATGTEEELLKRLWQKGRPPPQISKQDPQVSARELQLVRTQTYGTKDDKKKKCNC